MRARSALALLGAAALTTAIDLRAQSAAPPIEPVIDRIVGHVAAYYSRAQSLIGYEEVTQQPIRLDYSFDGFPTRYGYQLRLEWAPLDRDELPKATMMRELLTVNGRTPRPKDKPKCSQPREAWDEPLTMFLPEERSKFDFKWAGTGRVDGEATVSLEFRELSDRKKPPAPETSWDKSENEACVSFSLPGRVRGRVWVSEASGEVLRLDEQVSGPVDIKVPDEQQKHWHTAWLTLDRYTKSIRYKRVQFDDPAEALMLPSSIDVVSIFHGGAQPMRTSQRFTRYRRFMTGGRLVD